MDEVKVCFMALGRLQSVFQPITASRLDSGGHRGSNVALREAEGVSYQNLKSHSLKIILSQGTLHWPGHPWQNVYKWNRRVLKDPNKNWDICNLSVTLLSRFSTAFALINSENLEAWDNVLTEMKSVRIELVIKHTKLFGSFWNIKKNVCCVRRKWNKRRQKQIIMTRCLKATVVSKKNSFFFVRHRCSVAFFPCQSR